MHFPDEDAVLIRGRGDNWRKWYKVDLISSDTLLYIDSMAFNYKGNDLYVSNLVFSNNAKRAIICYNYKFVEFLDKTPSLGKAFVCLDDKNIKKVLRKVKN